MNAFLVIILVVISVSVMLCFLYLMRFYDRIDEVEKQQRQVHDTVKLIEENTGRTIRDMYNLLKDWKEKWEKK